MGKVDGNRKIPAGRSSYLIDPARGLLRWLSHKFDLSIDERNYLWPAYKKALFSEKVEVEGTLDEKQKEAVELTNALALKTARANALESWLITCNSDGKVESLFIIPKDFDSYAREAGVQVLRSNQYVEAVYDPENRIIYDTNCTAVTQSVEEAQKEWLSGNLEFPPNPVLHLTAPSAEPTQPTSDMFEYDNPLGNGGGEPVVPGGSAG